MPSIADNNLRIAIRMNGLEDIREKLLSLSKSVALGIIRGAMKDGAEVVRQEAVRNLQRNMTVRTGALAKSVIVRSGRANGPNKLSGYEEWAGVTIAPTVFESRLDEGGLRVLSVKSKSGQAPKGSIKPRSYAHLIEFGVRPHLTGKGSKLNETVPVYKAGKNGRRRLVQVPTGKSGLQHGREHDGFPAKPFMRPAFDSKQLQAEYALYKGARDRLARVLAKMSGQKWRKAA